MDKRYLLGIDLGGGSLKATLIAANGDILGSGLCGVTSHSPQLGWSEQEPADWMRALCAAVPLALARSGRNANSIAAISFSAGAHSQVITDGHGKPLRRAIMWNDQRSRLEVEALNEQHGERILEEGFNRCSPTWTLPQLEWVRRNEPSVAGQARRVYLAKDWLRAQLTGRFETDRIDALGTLMLDARTGRWSDWLCSLAGWDVATLPPIVEPTDVVGSVTADAARLTGLAEGTPVVCGSSDTAAETYGAGMTSVGMGVIKLATAATVSVLRRHVEPSRELISYYHIVPDHWYLITGTNSCASAHRWVRDQILGAPATEQESSASFAAFDAMAGAVPCGAAGLLFHPYLSGERSPHWDPRLRADFIGLTMRHGRAEMARAVYEGIAFSIRDCYEVFRARGLAFDTARIIGGGARSAVWRQIVADMLNVRVELPNSSDASFGAALIAGVGAGVFDSVQEAVARTVKPVASHVPDTRAVAIYDQLFPIYQSAQRVLVPVNHALDDFAQLSPSTSPRDIHP